MLRLAIIALVSSVKAHVFFESECPDPKPVENFNLAAYAHGRWYEVARYPHIAEKRATCGHADYVLEGDVIKVKNEHVENRKLFTIQGTVTFAEGAEKTGKLLLTLPYGPSDSESKNILRILATDYDNYAVGYFCKYDAEKKVRQDIAWILSRNKKLEGTVKETVENFIKESKVLDASKFVWPDSSDEACEFDT